MGEQNIWLGKKFMEPGGKGVGGTTAMVPLITKDSVLDKPNEVIHIKY